MIPQIQLKLIANFALFTDNIQQCQYITYQVHFTIILAILHPPLVQTS